MIAVPCTPGGESHWVQRTALDGRDFVLTFDWSQRDGHWYLSIADESGVAIASGRKLVSDWPLLRGVTGERRPPGELYVLDTRGAGLDPGFADLGTELQLWYFEAAEVAP